MREPYSKEILEKLAKKDSSPSSLASKARLEKALESFKAANKGKSLEDLANELESADKSRVKEEGGIKLKVKRNWPLMRIWILLLKAFAYVWITTAVLLIVAGTIGVWMGGGWSAVMNLLSPFNLLNWFVSILILVPGMAAMAWADKLKKRSF